MSRGSEAVTNIPRNWILFRTELFLYKQEDDQLDRWFVGGDCAGWIHVRLLPLPNIVYDGGFGMEDYGGWYASVRTEDTHTSVTLLIYAWPFLDHTWLIGLEAKKKLLQRQSPEIMRAAVGSVAAGIDHIVTSDDRFESFGWYEQNPFDTGMTDPREA